MNMRYWFNLILFAVSAYGTFVILLHTRLPYGGNDWRYYLYVIAPWVLLVCALKGWHRCFIWRRMLQDRQRPPVLSRGEHLVQKDAVRPSILERGCLLFLLVSLAAILKQLSIPHIQWWIGSLIGVWATLRLTIKRIG